MAKSKSRVVIDDRIWKQIKRRLRTLDRLSLQVGIVQGKGAEEATESGATLAEIGAVHEFGTKDGRIPERSFIRRTLEAKRARINDTFRRAAGAIVENRISVDDALNQLGSYVAGEIQATIKTGPHIPPPLSPATVAAKGSSRPLVDTGRLAQSISWRVKK